MMVIYYFTGTGNSLSVARRLAARFECQVIAIADAVRSSSVQTNAETVGIVFPAYLAALQRVPRIVEEFVERLEHLPGKRVFAVCTCGGYEIVNAAPALRGLSRLVKQRGARLAGEYTVRLPMNNLDYEHIPVPIETDTAAILRASELEIEDVCDRITRQHTGRYHVCRRLLTTVLTPLFWVMAQTCMKWLKDLACEPRDTALGFRQLVQLTDRSIFVDKSCTGCGICTKVCPVDNIKLMAGNPVWQHRCEMCFACDEWCPHTAIHHWGRPDGAKYHHPEIGLKDMIRQKGRAQR